MEAISQNYYKSSDEHLFPLKAMYMFTEYIDAEQNKILIEIYCQ